MKAIITALALVATAAAHAEFYDGNELMEGINSTSNVKYGGALGYIMGVTDTLRGVSTCPPPNTTAGQLRDMVKMYLEQYPANRTFTGDAIVHRVVSTAWPCQKKGSSL